MNWLDKFIVSERGQWEHPGKLTLVPTGNGKITTRGVKNDLIGIDNLGNMQYMTPENEYQFEGNMVYEIPMAYGGDISIPDLSRPNWLDKAQKGQQVKYYDDQLKFAKAKEAYDDSLEGFKKYPLAPYFRSQNINREEFLSENNPATSHFININNSGASILNSNFARSLNISPSNIRPTGNDWEWVYKRPTQKPVYKEKPKGYIPTKTVKLEREPIQLVMPQSDRMLNDYNNTLQVLRSIQQDDRDKQRPKVVPAPDFRYGGWLDKYQGNILPSEVRNRLVQTGKEYDKFNEALDWQNQWLDSPMYNQMVINSFKNDQSKADYLTKLRKENLQNLPGLNVNYGGKESQYGFDVAGTSDSYTGQVTVYPDDQYEYDPTLYIHELSHSSDRPRGKYSFEYPGYKTNKPGGYLLENNPELFKSGYYTLDKNGNAVIPPRWMFTKDSRFPNEFLYNDRVIPPADTAYIHKNRGSNWKDNQWYVNSERSLQPITDEEIALSLSGYNYPSDHPEYQRMAKELRDEWNTVIARDTKNAKETWKTFSHPYIAKPTEVRARLNEIRYNAQKENIYNPFTEQVTPETFKQLNGQPLDDLRKDFTDEEILWMLQNISYNDKKDNDKISSSKYGGWLDKYQGNKQPSQVRRDPNQPFFKSETEPGTYEAQYSQPEVTITPNWTEEELKRNQLRDKYIADDKKAWRHWYDKLGYDKENVTKRANQFAYNKLAKQYLKGDKDQLTAEQRKFIEKSEYANRLQPSIPSRFLKGVKQLNPINSIMYPENMPSGVMELMSNLAAPLEYPTNLVRGAVMGEFTDALKGQTPSPYFVSSDLAGTSPTEAAIASGLMDFGVDAGIGALGEIGTLSKGIKGVKSLVGKATKPLYNKLRGIEEYTPDYPFSFLGEDARSLSKDEYFKLLNERNSDIGKFKVTDTDEGDIWSSPGTRELQKKAHDEGVDFAHRWVISDPEKHKALKEELSQLPIKQKENTDKINAAADKFIKWTEENNIQTKNGFYDISPSNPKYSDFVQKHREYTSELETFKEFLRSDTKSKILDEFEKTVDPDFKKKVEAIYNAAGKEMPKYSGIENFDKGRHKLIYPGELESAQSLSDYSNDYVAKHFNTIGGVRTKDDTITLGSKPRQDYSYTTYKPFKYGKKTYIPKPSETTPLLNIRFSNEMIQPETIRGIAAHETGHDAQDLYDHFTGNIVESSPRFGYLTNTKDNPIAKRFKEAMVDPKDLTEQDKLAGKYYNYDTWLGAYDELHSETMKARGNVVAKYMEDYKMPLEDAVAAVKNMEREGNFELFNYYLEQQNLNKHFKPTTPKQERISLLKDYVPALLTGLGTAAALRKEKDGGWLDTYQDYNYIKYKDLSLSKGTGWLDNYK